MFRETLNDATMTSSPVWFLWNSNTNLPRAYQIWFYEELAPTFAALIPTGRLGRFAPSTTRFALAFSVASLPQALRFALAFSVALLPQALCFKFAFLVALLPRLCASRSHSRSLRSLGFCTLHSHQRSRFVLACVAAQRSTIIFKKKKDQIWSPSP